MGKNSKKVNKKKNQQIVKAENKHLMELKDKLTSQIDAMSYAAALDTLAELIDKRCYEPEVIYQGAQIYFLMGDYERAAAWVNNTLHYDQQHLGARLLLAKICLLEDRTDDAMSLYTFVLENYQGVLNDRQREDIKEGAEYIWRTDSEWLADNYPLVAGIWQKQIKENTEKTQLVDTEVTSSAKETAEYIMEEVLEKEISLAEKVQLLNMFAGGYFVERDFSGAEKLLTKALSLDGYNTQTLRNLAILFKMQGNGKMALAYAAKLPQIDFGLLRQLID